jgi:hypothetical protein
LVSYISPLKTIKNDLTAASRHEFVGMRSRRALA